MTRVVQFAESYGGGVRRHLRLLVPALRARSVEVDVVVSLGREEAGAGDDLAGFRELGCAVEALALTRGVSPVGDWCALQRLRRLLRSGSPCLLHAHSSKAGWVGRWAAAPLPDVRTVYMPHAFAFQAPGSPLRRWFLRLCEARLVSRTDHFVFVSEPERQAAVKALTIPEGRQSVIPNGLPEAFEAELLPAAEARSRLGVAAERVCIGMVGRLCPQKGQDLLLDALSLLRQAGKEVPLVVVCGDGPSSAGLQRRVQDRRVGDSVVWRGFVPDAHRALRAFDLLVFPSRYEACPYALLEALAAGVPALASGIPAHRLGDTESGGLHLVPAGEPAALARMLEQWCGEADAWARAAAKAAPAVRDRYSLAAQADALADVYRRLY